jgi:AsmA protein
VGKPIKSSRWSRLARYLAYCAAALVAIVIAAAFILPEFLDSPAVRAQIQRKLSEAVQGEVGWDDLSIRILPAPRGVLRKARVEIPGIASVRAEEINARLLFWPLLRGRAEITTVSVVRPEIRIDIAPSPVPDGKNKQEDAEEPDPFAAYRSII